MSTLGRRLGTPRLGTLPRRRRLPFAPAGRPYFVLGQNAQGLWVIRESTGKKSGVFTSRKAALRFARLESPDENFAVVHVCGTVEFDYASQHL